MPKKLCECGEALVYREGVCASCWLDKHGHLPSHSEIERMKLLIRRENGHDPKQPRLFQAARH